MIEIVVDVGCVNIADGKVLVTPLRVEVRVTEMGFPSSSTMYEAMLTVVVTPKAAVTVGITEVNRGAVFVT